MGIFDAFTGAAAKKASAAQIAGLRDASDVTQWGFGEARNQLTGEAIPTLQEGYADAIKALQQYYPEAQGYAGQATAAYDPMIASGQQGVDAYKTAMGLGPGGSAGAQEAFRNTPGYQFALNQGTDAALRARSAQGLLASGNATTDVMNYGTGLADQTYGSYLSRLNPLMNMYTAGIGGQASGLTNQANLASNMGANTAALHKGMGTDIANVYGNVANTYTNEAQSRGKILSDIGAANAGGILGAANAQAGTINQGINLVGSLMGAPTGGGTSFGMDLFKRYAMGGVPASYG